MDPRINRLSLYLTIIAAMVIETIPMPLSLVNATPSWVMLTLVYWSVAHPQRINIGVAFITGLALSSLSGFSLGAHSLALIIVVYIATSMHAVIRNMPTIQQLFGIFIATAVYQFSLYWSHSIISDTPFRMVYLLPSVTTTLIAPWAFWFLRQLNQRFVKVY